MRSEEDWWVGCLGDEGEVLVEGWRIRGLMKRKKELFRMMD